MSGAVRLTQLEALPSGLLDAGPEELHTILPGPTLIHLPGREPRPLFVSLLLHGNETTGLLAMQALLKRHVGRDLPRALSVFLGNVDAARAGVRRLEDQPDYNRIWPGTEHGRSPETAMAGEVVEEMARRRVYASIDIHNNTGLNPHYACLNRLDHRFLQLAALFDRLVVYFLRPKGVQSAAFARLCPSVTLECGKPGQPHGVKHAFGYLQSCLHLSEIPGQPVAPRDIDLFHTVAQVFVRDGVSFSFRDEAAEFFLPDGLDHMNFTEIPAGKAIGTVNCDRRVPVIVRDEAGDEVTERYFRLEERRLVLRRRVMPSMLTLDADVIRQDCFCYLMERMHL